MSQHLHHQRQMHTQSVDISKLKSKSTESIFLHSHSFYEIILITQGSAEYLIGSKTYLAQKGDLMLIPPNIPHQIMLSTTFEDYERYIVWIDHHFWERVTQLFPSIHFAMDTCTCDTSYLIRPHSTTTESLLVDFTRIHEIFYNQSFNWEDTVIAHTLTLMTTINSILYSLSFEATKPVAPSILDQLLHYVDTHLDQTISTADIARYVNTSPSNISRICKNKLNISLYQFVLKRRLLYSKNQILADIPLNVIYQNVGFSDYSAFYRAFKKEFDVSPSDFRRSAIAKEPNIEKKPL